MQAFDELLLLKRGGETIFCGPIGQDSATLIAYFRSYGCRWIVGVPLPRRCWITQSKLRPKDCAAMPPSKLP